MAKPFGTGGYGSRGGDGRRPIEGGWDGGQVPTSRGIMAALATSGAQSSHLETTAQAQKKIAK